jgi:hypothetical protein
MGSIVLLDLMGGVALLLWGLPMSPSGHSRPSRLARNATYDRSCLKADIRRAALRVVVEVEIAEHLAGGVADDERRGRQLRRPTSHFTCWVLKGA